MPNELLKEAGIFYTTNEELANELGYKQSIYKQQYIRIEEHGIEERFIYTLQKDDVYRLINYWNSKNSAYKYWI